MHGKQSEVELDQSSVIFGECPKKALIARYHSLAADPTTIPDCLKVTAVTEDGEVMAVEHKDMPLFGLQFHPESIMTPDGRKMLKGFLSVSV